MKISAYQYFISKYARWFEEDENNELYFLGTD
jgi:hypothetical protein